jgi:hypothetical protein
MLDLLTLAPSLGAVEGDFHCLALAMAQVFGWHEV